MAFLLNFIDFQLKVLNKMLSAKAKTEANADNVLAPHLIDIALL